MVLESCQVRSLEIHGETDSLSKIDTPKLPESVLLNQSLSEYVAFHDFALESHIYIFKKATCNHYCIEYTVYHYYTLSICIVQSTCLGRTELWISYSAAERKKTSRQPWSWLVGFPNFHDFLMKHDETWFSHGFPWISSANDWSMHLRQLPMKHVGMPYAQGLEPNIYQIPFQLVHRLKTLCAPVYASPPPPSQQNSFISFEVFQELDNRCQNSVR